MAKTKRLPVGQIVLDIASGKIDPKAVFPKSENERVASVSAAHLSSARTVGEFAGEIYSARTVADIAADFSTVTCAPELAANFHSVSAAALLDEQLAEIKQTILAQHTGAALSTSAKFLDELRPSEQEIEAMLSRIDAMERVEPILARLGQASTHGEARAVLYESLDELQRDRVLLGVLLECLADELIESGDAVKRAQEHAAKEKSESQRLAEKKIEEYREAAEKIKRVKAGPENRADGKDRKAFKAAIETDPPKIEKWADLHDLWRVIQDRLGVPVESQRTYEAATLRAWYKQVYPEDKLKGGRPKKNK